MASPLPAPDHPYTVLLTNCEKCSPREVQQSDITPEFAGCLGYHLQDLKWTPGRWSHVFVISGDETTSPRKIMKLRQSIGMLDSVSSLSVDADTRFATHEEKDTMENKAGGNDITSKSVHQKLPGDLDYMQHLFDGRKGRIYVLNFLTFNDESSTKAYKNHISSLKWQTSNPAIVIYNFPGMQNYLSGRITSEFRFRFSLSKTFTRTTKRNEFGLQIHLSGRMTTPQFRFTSPRSSQQKKDSNAVEFFTLLSFPSVWEYGLYLNSVDHKRMTAKGVKEDVVLCKKTKLPLSKTIGLYGGVPDFFG